MLRSSRADCMNTPDDTEENANVICFRPEAKRFGKSQEPQPRTYTLEWKSACLEVLELYRETLRERLNRKKVGWKYIRDLAMVDFDSFEQSKRTHEDIRLTRQDLESWSKGLSILSDSKFYFIDILIRKLMVSGELDIPYASLIRTNELQYKRVLRSLYCQTGAYTDEIAEYAERVQGAVFHAVVRHSIIKEVYLIFDDAAEIIMSVTALIVRDSTLSDANDLNSIPDGSYFMRGFVIPISVEEKNGSISGTINFFRPEYKGDEYDGYADVSFFTDVNDEIHISWAHHLLTDIHHRLVPVFYRKEYYESERRDGSFALDDYIDGNDKFKFEQISGGKYKNENFIKNLKNMFKTSYKGYIL